MREVYRVLTVTTGVCKPITTFRKGSYMSPKVRLIRPFMGFGAGKVQRGMKIEHRTG